MRIARTFTGGLFLMAVFAVGPGLAADAGESASSDAPALHMPGDPGTGDAPIRINRGSGFAPMPKADPARGVVRDASRPVTVSDVRASRTGRPVPEHRWGASSGTRLRVVDDIYIWRDGHLWDRWYRHRQDHLDRRRPHRPERRHAARHGRDIVSGAPARGYRGAVFVPSKGFGLWVGH